MSTVNLRPASSPRRGAKNALCGRSLLWPGGVPSSHTQKTSEAPVPPDQGSNPREGDDDPFHQDQPPRQGPASCASVTTHLPPPACLQTEYYAIMGTDTRGSLPVFAQTELIHSPLFTRVRGRRILRTSALRSSQKFESEVPKRGRRHRTVSSFWTGERADARTPMSLNAA